jgi:SNF2 family DNA or RNA helicase
VLDESQRVKTAGTNRSVAAFHVATAMREAFGTDCYVLEMTGTPSPKSPVDWWQQAEIACPGYLREGTPASFQRRLSFFENITFLDGTSVNKPCGWKDDEAKCKTCGKYADDEIHNPLAATALGKTPHKWEPSINEVALLRERLKGLAIVKLKKDCLDLPDKIYRPIYCQPKPSTFRAAQLIYQTSPNAMTAMTLLRELSDGFQYTDEESGLKTCPYCEGEGEIEQWVDPNDEERTYSQTDFLSPEALAELVKETRCCPTCDGEGKIMSYVRKAEQLPCPKVDALKDLLEENEDHGRIVIFAGFTGSVDRCVEVCQQKKWTVVRVDGRGWTVFGPDGQHLTGDPLDLWSDLSDNDLTRRVAFVAHPGSGGVGLTLTEASMIVYYSNDFSPESRSQSEDRIHRPGMDYARGATIVDLLHLPSDERVLEILRDNRRLELMTLSELGNVFETKTEDYDYGVKK